MDPWFDYSLSCAHVRQFMCVCVYVRESFFSSHTAQHWHIWGTQQALPPSCDEMDGALFIPLNPGQDLFVCNMTELPDRK